MKRLCKCGCGAKVANLFVSGHNLVIEQRKNIGKKYSRERVDKQRRSLVEHYMEPGAKAELAKKMEEWWGGKSKEWKEDFALAISIRWDDPKYRAKMSKAFSDAMSSEKRKFLSKISKANWSDPEKRAALELARVAGINKFWKEHPEVKQVSSERMKGMWLNKTLRRKLSEGQAMYCQSEAGRKQRAQTSTEYWQSPEYRQKQVASSWRRTKVVTKKAGTFYCRLSWEEAFVKIVDSSPLVKKFEYEPFGIPYVWRGKDCTYYPDFLLELNTGEKFVVEIKGKERKRDIAKYMAAERYCRNHGMEFAIVREKPMEPLSRYIQ